MSGICGIAGFGERPIDEYELHSMADAAPHRAVDGVTFWRDDCVGFAHLSTIVTPESQYEHQPLVDGEVVLVADARVDNRADLMRTLGLTASSPTDTDLIMAAYRYWGVDCLAHIIGDFAFALWDGCKHRLLLARDPMGMRALYYRREAERLLFATEVKQIISVPGVPIEIFEPALAAYLAGPNMPPEWTFYDGIDQLPASHALLLEGGRQHVWRFWDIDPAYRIHYKDEAEYAEHFRELFKEAVACRLRSIKPVGLALSGGLDSGSIASTAGWLMQQNSPHAYPPFLAVCHAFNENPECDERHISSLITNPFGFASIDVPADQAFPLKDYPLHGPDRDEPLMGAFQALSDLDLASAREHHASVLMSGSRGDLVTAGVGFDYWGMLLKGHWNAVRNEIRAESQLRQQPISRLIRREYVSPLISGVWPQDRASALRETVRRSIGRPPSATPRKAAPWVREDFAQRTHLEQTARQYQLPRSPIRESGRRQRYERIFADVQMRAIVCYRAQPGTFRHWLRRSLE